MAKREAPPLFMRREGSGLSPASQLDAEIVEGLPRGVDLEIAVKHRKRSLPQLRAYWAGLGELVRATEAYPTPEHLHEAIKFHLGYVKPLQTVTGHQVYVPDSAAFDAMDGSEFKTFLERAQRLCLEQWGFDIMGTQERKAA